MKDMSEDLGAGGMFSHDTLTPDTDFSASDKDQAN